jgi:lipopolysaccharide transport system ATP-binding protein
MRRGDGRAELLSIDVPSSVMSGEEMSIRVNVRYAAAVADPVVGIMIRTRIGMEVYGTNTELEKVQVGPCEAGDTRSITFRFACNLCPQSYTVTAASHDPDGVWHDWMEDAVAFTVGDTRYTAGVANLRAKVELSGSRG